MPVFQTASLASVNVREHAGVRLGCGRLRENAVPARLMFYYRPFAKHVQNVFRSLRRFPDKRYVPIHRRGLELRP